MRFNRPTCEITLCVDGDRLHLKFPWDEQIKTAINLLPNSDRQWQNPYHVVFPVDCLEIIRQIGRSAIERHTDWVFLDRTQKDVIAIADQKKLHEARLQHQKSQEFKQILNSCDSSFSLVEWDKDTIKLQFQKMLGSETFELIKSSCLKIGKEILDSRDNPKLRRGWWFCIPYSPELLNVLIAKNTQHLKKIKLHSFSKEQQPTTFPQVCHFHDEGGNLWVGLLLSRVPRSFLNDIDSSASWQLAEFDEDWYWVGQVQSIFQSLSDALCGSLRYNRTSFYKEGLASVVSKSPLSRAIKDLGLAQWTCQYLQQLSSAAVIPSVNPNLYQEPFFKQQVRQKLYYPDGYIHPMDTFLNFYQAQSIEEQQAISQVLGWETTIFEQWFEQIFAQKQKAAHLLIEQERQMAIERGQSLLDSMKKLQLLEVADKADIAIKKSWKLEQIRVALTQSNQYQLVCEKILGIPAQLEEMSADG